MKLLINFECFLLFESVLNFIDVRKCVGKIVEKCIYLNFFVF